MAAPSERLNISIRAHDQSGNQREAIWAFGDDAVPTTVWTLFVENTLRVYVLAMWRTQLLTKYLLSFLWYPKSMSYMVTIGDRYWQNNEN